MVGPEDDDGVLGVGAGIEGVEHAPDEGVGVAHAGEVAVEGLLDRPELDQALVDAGAVGLLSPDVFREVVEVVRLVGWQLNFFAFVEVEIFLRAVVGEVRGVQSHREEEGLVPLFAQLVDRPLGPHGIGEFLLAIVGDGAELHEPAVGLGGSGGALVGAVGLRVGEGDLVRPRVHRVPGLPLSLGAYTELVPSAHVDGPGGVVKELAGAHGAVAGFLEAGLERAYPGVVDEVEGAVVASGGGGELSGEYGGPRWGAEHARGVGVGKIHPAFCQAVDVRGDGGGGGAVAPDPVVHVVHRDEQHVGSLGDEVERPEQECEQDETGFLREVHGK